MPVPAMPLPVVGGDDSIEEPKIPDALQELQQILDPAYIGLGSENMTTALKVLLGLDAAHAGAVSLTAGNTWTTTSYGPLASPDRVSNIVLPTNALLRVRYRALWAESVNDIARAAIFINGTQLKASSTPAPIVDEVAMGNGSLGETPNTYVQLSTRNLGLQSDSSQSPSITTPEVTTGQIMPAPLDVYLPAGTYTVEVRFKVVGAGTIFVKNRRLWVAAVTA